MKVKFEPGTALIGKNLHIFLGITFSLNAIAFIWFFYTQIQTSLRKTDKIIQINFQVYVTTNKIHLKLLSEKEFVEFGIKKFLV